MANTIKNGINFLSQEQQPDGSFFSLVSTDPSNFQEAELRPTVFFTTLILQSLNALPNDDKITTLKQKAADFLLSQKNKHWTFNYWARQSPEFKNMPYPDDLDDTSCALSALFQYNPKLINGRTLGKFVMLLTALEKQEGGPYRTWVVKPDADKAWKDVDLAVNSNIAHFLFLQEVELPNLINFIEQAIEAKKFHSPYYASPYSVIYFISKSYTGDKKQQIIDYLFEQQNQNSPLSGGVGGVGWNNPLDTALAILALLNFKVDHTKLKQSIAYLLENQQNDSWKPYPFVVDLIKKEATYYAGSPALTTAFCLEAITKYLEQENKKTKNLSRTAIREQKNNLFENDISKERQAIYESVIKAMQEKISTLDENLKNQTQKTLDKILATNKDKQIALLPYFFKNALGQNGNNIACSQLINLGLVNICGWTAYNIYDDFIDDEGDPKLISVANLLLRELTTIFNNLLPADSNPLFQKIMNGIDAANLWEVMNCRAKITDNNLTIPENLPDYGGYSKLAERSMGHALGPIAILFLLGYKEDSPEMKNLILFFKHYIIARQLNDDAHDWEEDLKKGHLDAVVVEVLKKFNSQLGIEFPHTQQINLKKTIPNLQQIFWFEVVTDICNQVLEHIELAKQSLKKINIITNPSILEKFLEPVAASARKALKEREETIKFLEVYT